MAHHFWTPEEDKILIELYLYKRWHLAGIAKKFNTTKEAVYKRILRIRRSKHKNSD